MGDSMKTEKKGAIRYFFEKYCFIIGGFLILITSSFINTWGNISVYVMSYFYSHYGQFCGSNTSWLACTLVVGVSFGPLISGSLRLCPRNVVLSVTSIVSSVSLCICYIALKYELSFVLFCGFIFLSLSDGIAFSRVYKSVAEVVDSKSQGLCISIISAGSLFGTFVSNIFTSMYINPENRIPDLRVGNVELFDQPEIVEKVPSTFIILGLWSFVCKIIGIFLLNSKTPLKIISEEPKASGIAYGSTDGIEIEIQVSHNGNTDNINCENVNGKDTVKEETRERTTKETLRTYAFYTLWFSWGCQFLPWITFNNYYKTFGQVWIKDDHFLTAVGSVRSIVSGVARVVWGFVLVRMTIRSVMVWLFSVYSVFSMFVYFTPMLDKYLYFITINVMSFHLSVAAPTFVTAILTFFGTKHFETNYGLMYSSGLVASLASPVMLDSLLSQFGWFSIFAANGFLCSVPLAAIILGSSKFNK